MWAVYEDKEGTLWIGTYGGLNKLNREKETFTRYLPQKSVNKNMHIQYGNWIDSIIPARENHLWVGTRQGLNLLDLKTRKFTPYPIFPNDPNHNSNWIRAIYKDGSGKLWIGTYGGLKLFLRNWN